MGASFLNIGNEDVWSMNHTFGCILIAVVCSGILFVTALSAKLLKRTSRNFKTNYIYEVILLGLFVLFATFLTFKSSPFTHFFTVTAQKSEINSKLQLRINQAENMFIEYETYANNRENLYKHKLASVVSGKWVNSKQYNAYGFNGSNGVSDASQIATKMFTIHADLFPSNYSDTINHNGIKEIAMQWLRDAKSTTSSWKPISIVGVVDEIDNYSNEWLNGLVVHSQIRENGEIASDFSYPLTFDDVKTHFTLIDSPSGLALSLAVLSYILMLLSWFITKRDTRVRGANETMNYEVVL